MDDLIQRLGAMDANSSQPLYLQLQRALQRAISEGWLGPEDALPSERQLAAGLAISRITVRKALDALSTEGLLVSRRGAGNFVAPPAHIDKHFAKLTSFSEDMRSRGFEPSSEWLRRSSGAVRSEEALKLGLGPGSPVYRFERLRFADGRPMAIEIATVVGTALASEHAVVDSLYDALDQTVGRPVRALQRLSAVLLDDEQAQRLRTEPDSAGLRVERVGFGRDGRAIEMTISVYRGETYDFVAELASS